MTTKIQALADKLFPVAAAQEDDAELRNIPPEQRRLHTETADLTVGSLHQLMATGKIEIPEFQRGYVWTRTQASRLIESLIIQCPIPVVYFSQSPNNNLIVIDGNQRLMSIKLFLNDGFELQGLTTYPELIGYTWSQLDPRFRDHINNRTIRCITILKDTHPQIKFDVFERLNTGSVKLNGQELRHGVNHGSLMKRVDELVKNETWKKLSGIKSDKRMKGAELILRFFAFRHSREIYSKPLSGFLDTFTTTYRSISENELDEWTSEFLDNLNLVDYYFGKNAFKIIKPNLTTAGNFNSAIYDAQMIGMAETNSARLRGRLADRNSVQQGFVDLMTDPAFAQSVQRATSDEASVNTRISRAIQLFNRF
ncbi:GmrSD restriction endonuclease domain-containing protein [Brucella pituitosa]|uniref:GmrSD restriction endonuclease domain-containing protein n=1 Tax=Brucella pituitosa TaxID=571256 RepID=UPI003F4AD688